MDVKYRPKDDKYCAEHNDEAEGVSTSVLTLGVTRLKLVRSTALCFTAIFIYLIPPGAAHQTSRHLS